MPVSERLVAIEATHLTFERNGENIIHEFSFRVNEGDYVGVIGPNGGGKTTLLRLLLGLAKPSHGQVHIFGYPPSDRRARQEIGYVPQRGGNLDPLFPATVAEVIRSGRTPRLGLFSSFGAADERAVKKAVKEIGIEKLLARPMSKLSGGERQKVLLARALAQEPKMLFLDEPVDGLDPASRDAFYTLLRKLNGAGMTIIFVTHDVHAIAAEANAALCLKHQLVCHGHKACLIDKEELQDLVHGNPEEIRKHHDT